MLWLLVYAAGHGKPKLLNQAIERLTLSEIRQLHISAAPADGPYKGMTVLWLLLEAGLHKAPATCLAMLTKFGRTMLEPSMLNAAPATGSMQGVTVLELFCFLAFNGYTQGLKKVITALPENMLDKLELNTRILHLLGLLAMRTGYSYLNKIFGALEKKQLSFNNLAYLNLMIARNDGVRQPSNNTSRCDTFNCGNKLAFI